MKFKAAILVETKKPLIIDEISINKLYRGQVLVKLNQSGVCRSQLFEIDGERGEDKWLPHLLGHEAIGEVVDVGEGVKTVQKGDNVVLSWIKSEGISAEPAKYNWGNKIVNSGRVTTFSEYTICSEDRCIQINKTLTSIVGASLGCAIPTGYGLGLTLYEMKFAKYVGIVGLGGIGMSALLGVQNESNAKIIAIDLSEERLYQAKKLGAHHIINASKVHDLKNEIKKINPNLLDIVIECSGSINALNNSLKLIQNKGIVKFVSHPRFGDLLSIDPFELILGKRIEGSWGGGINPDIHLNKIAKKVSKNKDFLEIYSKKEYSLEDINNAILDLKSLNVLRPIINLQTSKGNS
tara:strand:- start:1032 stop:2084 length:1053 start_codon:yes stop_codon:yes gene_type:complete